MAGPKEGAVVYERGTPVGVALPHCSPMPYGAAPEFATSVFLMFMVSTLNRCRVSGAAVLPAAPLRDDRRGRLPGCGADRCLHHAPGDHSSPKLVLVGKDDICFCRNRFETNLFQLKVVV